MPATLTLNNNIIELPNSKYIINGLSENTLNKLNISAENNTYDNSFIKLCDPNSKSCSNIVIKSTN